MSRITTETEHVDMYAPWPEAGPDWAHVAGCLGCRLLLSGEDEVRRRLALLRVGEPRIDVLDQVMEQIGEQP
jgi:hypothetical protein